MLFHFTQKMKIKIFFNKYIHQQRNAWHVSCTRYMTSAEKWNRVSEITTVVCEILSISLHVMTDKKIWAMQFFSHVTIEGSFYAQIEQANLASSNLYCYFAMCRDLIHYMSFNHNILKHRNNHGSMTAYFRVGVERRLAWECKSAS